MNRNDNRDDDLITVTFTRANWIATAEMLEQHARSAEQQAKSPVCADDLAETCIREVDLCIGAANGIYWGIFQYDGQRERNAEGAA